MICVQEFIRLIWPSMLSRRVLPVFLLLAICASTKAVPPATDIAGFRIVHTYPHDPRAFTQGLLYVDGHLYEGTGLNGSLFDSNGRPEHRSSTSEVRSAEGVFGEGLTDWGSTLVELTWQAHKGFVYDRFTFSLLKTFAYEGEGWGLTHDDKHLIMSDGTSYLRFLDPNTFARLSRIHVVAANGQGIEDLNELE